MLKLIKRCPEFVDGYKEYCQEAYDSHVTYFVPADDPAKIDDGWFARTKEWYEKKESGQIPDQPIGFQYWAVDDNVFVGEFQLRPELTEEIMTGTGNGGDAVRVSQQGKGYGTALLNQGLVIARNHNMKKVLLNINDANAVSIHICEKLGGKLMDIIRVSNNSEGDHLMRRY